MHTGVAGHPNGPRRSMSVTKLKTVGSWHLMYRQDEAAAGPRTASVRGRVITEMLTGGAPSPNVVTVAQNQHQSETS